MTAERSWDQLIGLRLCAGDSTALGEAYDQLSGLVYGLARRVTRDATWAEDVTQEVFCQLWERPDRFDPERGTLRTFLATLTHRSAVDRIRSVEASRRREARQLQPDAIHPDIAEQVGAYLSARSVRSAVQALPPEQRQAISLAYFDGHTYREVAALLDISEGTVKSRIRLALQKLRGALGSEQGTGR